VAVVSNAPTENAHAMLAAIGLAGRIGTIVLGDDCPKGKPDPFPYAEAMRRLGVDPADAVAFEDSRAGLTSASAAGAFAVGVASSLSADALTACGARLVIRDFTDPALEPALVGRP
jgi:HAD superfamily hydrolase (TIGR01509 family)